MKTFRIVIMVGLVLVTVFFILFAYIQRGYAEEALQQAEVIQAEAYHNAQRLEEMKMRLEEQEAYAIKMAEQYHELKKECQGN